jgi:hypothetical protein
VVGSRPECRTETHRVGELVVASKDANRTEGLLRAIPFRLTGINVPDSYDECGDST